MSLEQSRVRLIDSLNFLPMALSAMPGTLGEKELEKGHFPHHFNTPETAYVGNLPPPEMYGVEYMKEGTPNYCRFHEISRKMYVSDAQTKFHCLAC